MGHSAGAHLAGLLSTDAALRQRHGVQPWLATVLLDSAALDVAAIMRGPHFPLYDKAFGRMPRAGRLSPTRLLSAGTPPLLAVCSATGGVLHAGAGLADKGRQAGVVVQVLPQDLSHGQINQQLGLAGDYTRQVDRFAAGRLEGVALSLAGKSVGGCSVAADHISPLGGVKLKWLAARAGFFC
jgi:acetyl esterase/lipase